MGFLGRLLVFYFILTGFQVQAQNETTSSLKFQEFDNESYKELSFSEWKRFKSFEDKLASAQFENNSRESQLRSYVRDSIQILGVKLMAIKLLDEKELLNKDISENKEYYMALLGELQESPIPPAEYLFLEEKLALLNQDVLENKLAQSRWLNIGLIVLCFALVLIGLRLRSTSKKLETPGLSRQERTVKALILQGKTNKEIANELFISLSTVKTHITNIYGKLNVANRQELIQNGTRAST